MQCPNCKSEWNVGKIKSQQQLTTCPFCGESLVTKAEEKPDTSTFRGVLRSLVLEIGTDLYKSENTQKLRAYLSDMAIDFTKERKTMNIAIQENIPSKLIECNSKKEEEKQMVMYDCIHQLEEECGLSKERATEVVNSLVVGLGWRAKFDYEPVQQSSQWSSQSPVKSHSPQHTTLSELVPPKNMVYVKGGSFWMGNDAGHDDEKPLHEVRVSSFFIGKHEVTQAEYQTIIGKNPSYFRGNNLPVENVRWYEAVEYCNRLSKKEGLTPCYSGSGDNITCNWNANGYRLPTEAEWEYAAKGGINKDGYRYSGSDNIDEVAWYEDNSGKSTHNVGIKKANSLGIFDMSGNVGEWCWDWYDSEYYSRSSKKNRTGVISGVHRVSRGGFWNYSANNASVYCRSCCDPSVRSSGIGFRVVRAAKIKE